MTTLTKVQMPSLVSTMLTCEWEELNLFEGNTSSCFRLAWQPSKVSWTTSWVPMCSLPWAQCNRWIPMGSMGCVHTHWRIPAIEGWGSPSYIWSTMKKIGEVSWKLRKVGQIVSQAPALGPKHDKIWTRWVSHFPLESMLERVWLCKHSKMESWIEPFVVWWVVQMKEDECKLWAVRDHMLPWGVARKGRCYYQFVLKLQEGRDIHWS